MSPNECYPCPRTKHRSGENEFGASRRKRGMCHRMIICIKFRGELHTRCKLARNEGRSLFHPSDAVRKRIGDMHCSLLLFFNDEKSNQKSRRLRKPEPLRSSDGIMLMVHHMGCFMTADKPVQHYSVYPREFARFSLCRGLKP